MQAAAAKLGQDMLVLSADTDSEIDAAFATFTERRVAALIVIGDVFFFTRRYQITALAARHRIPAIYHQRDFVEVGGLMSYATSIGDGFTQLGIYIGKILKGAKPGDLPVQQSSRVEFVINLTAAKSLGLEFHPQLLATADEVIE
jgi:putative ABC transport system substrate-binding protein